jgi:hypothetical protein
MASTVDELTVSYSEGGQELCRELDKIVLTKGAWATVMYKYQDWDARKNEYGNPKFTIRRYRKRNDQYLPQTKFNISSVDQAKKVIEALEKWVGEAD